jgi:hypothetical protein
MHINITNHERNIAADVAIDMDVDVADDVDTETHVFMGQYQVGQIFSAY